MNVEIDSVRDAGQELNHLHLCQVPLPWAVDLEGRHEVVAVHQNVDKGVAQGPEVAVAPTVHLNRWNPRKKE